MEVVVTSSPQEFVGYADDCLGGHPGVIVHLCSDPCVWTGQLQTLNTDSVKAHGLFVGVGQYIGGSIVNMPGDVSVCITTWLNSELAPTIVAAFVQYLRDHDINVTTDENDVLVDDKKVVSWARATTGRGWCQSVVHFSVGPIDLPLVEDVCSKPMMKIPGSLSDYNISTDDILTFLQPLLQSNS